MKDYNEPPTEEFKMLTESPIRNNFNGWFTIQKSVMNDYWFDHVNYHEFTAMELDHLFHKLYYCWKMMGEEMYGQIEMDAADDDSRPSNDELQDEFEQNPHGMG